MQFLPRLHASYFSMHISPGLGFMPVLCAVCHGALADAIQDHKGQMGRDGFTCKGANTTQMS